MRAGAQELHADTAASARRATLADSTIPEVTQSFGSAGRLCSGGVFAGERGAGRLILLPRVRAREPAPILGRPDGSLRTDGPFIADLGAHRLSLGKGRIGTTARILGVPGPAVPALPARPARPDLGSPLYFPSGVWSQDGGHPKAERPTVAGRPGGRLYLSRSFSGPGHRGLGRPAAWRALAPTSALVGGAQASAQPHRQSPGAQ